LELRHLRYFVAVAEALNFTKASARLRVAQPALSRQMTDLEDEIGVDLMKRSPRGVTLTAEGKLFLDEVRELLKRADESVKEPCRHAIDEEPPLEPSEFRTVNSWWNERYQLTIKLAPRASLIDPAFIRCLRLLSARGARINQLRPCVSG
jgi:DNA-binding transcriptional ArsR family regulator